MYGVATASSAYSRSEGELVSDTCSGVTTVIAPPLPVNADTKRTSVLDEDLLIDWEESFDCGGEHNDKAAADDIQVCMDGCLRTSSHVGERRP